jgi:ABC-type antimicrobial peptide transport system permease subunit
MAVGADRAAIVTSVLREGLTLAAMGCSTGLVGGLALSGLLRSLLFGVSPTDPRTFAMVVLVLGLAGALASLLPAVSASRVDPVKALRAD